MSTTFTTTAKALREWLDPAARTCGTDDHPIVRLYNMIEVSVGEAWAVAASTDRFRASLSRTPITPDAGSEPATAYIALTDVKRLLTLFKPSARFNPEVTVTVSPGSLAVTGSDLTLTVAGHDIDDLGNYPNLRDLFASAIRKRGPSTARNVNPQYVAEMRHVCRRGETLRIHMTDDDRGPLLFVAGDRYLGLVMPMLPDTDPDADIRSWAGICAGGAA